MSFQLPQGHNVGYLGYEKYLAGSLAHSRSTATVAIVSLVCLGKRGCLPVITVSLLLTDRGL